MGGEDDPKKVTRVLGQGKDETYTLQFSQELPRGSSKARANFPFRLFVIGAVYYTDIFGKQRYARFCIIYVTPAVGGYCTEHNDAN
jgi:hypothetical protein